MGKSTGKASGCAVPDTSGIQDRHAELVVLGGLLRLGRRLLADLTLTRGHFYHDAHGELFDVCCYAAYGGTTGPVLVDVFREYRQRKLPVTGRWLADVWFTDPWFGTIKFWATHDDGQCLWHWCALAAAARVLHLAARRAAIYAAHEVIRDALSPTGDAAEITRMTDRIAQEEY